MNSFDQDPLWYEKNRNNYQNSIRKNYSQYTNGNTDMHFLPADLIRYGEIIKISTDQLYNNGQPLIDVAKELWVIRIPAGMTVYHSSRSLAVNNAEYPLIYNINLSSTDNRNAEQQRIDNLQDVDPMTGNIVKCYEKPEFFSWCIANTYFASIPQEEYLHKDYGFLGDQIRYSYGLDTFTKDTTLNSMSADQFNDRIANVANEHNLGIAAYQTKKDSYYIAIPDDTFINRGYFGVRNTISLLYIIYGQNFDRLFNDRTYGDPILSSSGLSLGANLRRTQIFMGNNKKEVVKYFSDRLFPYIYAVGTQPNINLAHSGVVGLWYRALQEYYPYSKNDWLEPNDSKKASLKAQFTEFLSFIYDNDTIEGLPINDILVSVYGRPIIPGIRMSDYEADRPWHTQVRELLHDTPLITSSNKQIQIEGIIGGLLFNPRWCPFGQELGTQQKDKCRKISYFLDFKNQILVPSNNDGFFHSELIAFYAPDILDRDYNNYADYRYRINSLGVLTEMRKYKTTNILSAKGGFHQGHLYEHSIWTALNSYLLHNDIYRSIDIGFIDPNVITVAAILHDVGKAGRCFYEPPPRNGQDYDPDKLQIGLDYKDYNPHTIPEPYWCNVVKKDGKELGFSYGANIVHPEQGYRYLKGFESFKMYAFDDDTAYEDYKLVSLDWEQYRKAIGLDWQQIKLVRIAVACHWDFGPVASNYNSFPTEQVVIDYLRKVERYYNAEFGVFNAAEFIKAVYITMIISVGDIYGSMYNPELESNIAEKIYNQFSNYHLYRAFIQAGVSNLTPAILVGNEYLYDMRVVSPINNQQVTVRDILTEINSKPDLGTKTDIYQLFYDSTAIENPEFAPLQFIMELVYKNSLAEQLAEFTKQGASYNLTVNSTPRQYANIARTIFSKFFQTVLKVVDNRIFVPNPYNTFMVLENLLYNYENVPTLYSGHYRFAPKVIIFDLDETIFLQGPATAQRGEYNYFTDIEYILQVCKFLRSKYGVKLAIASRHYIPKLLLEEISKPESPLYYRHFDIIISQYTGPLDTLNEYCEKLWPMWSDSNVETELAAIQRCKSYLEPCNSKTSEFQTIKDYEGNSLDYCPTQTHGFVIYNGQYYIGNYVQEPESGKGPHLQILTSVLQLPAEDMIFFDDGESYVKGQQLGGYKVYTAGVNKNYGLTAKLFYIAIALYIYDKFIS